MVMKMKKGQERIFIFALFLSVAFHALAFLSLGFCIGRFHLWSVAGDRVSDVNLLEIGFVLPPLSALSPETAGLKTEDPGKDSFVPVPSDITVTNLPREEAKSNGDGSTLLPEGRAGQSDRTDSTEIDEYLSRVRQKIEEAIYYPRRARLSHLEGAVKVGFSIGTGGVLNFSRVIDPSPHDVLNAASLDIIGRAAPFPEPREDLVDKEVAVAIEFKSTY